MNYKFFGEEFYDNGNIIVLPNPLAAGLEGDAGDRAQHLSEHFHTPVLAYERPSTVDLDRLPILSVNDYIEGIATRSQELNDILNNAGYSRIDIYGNSAGALEALGLAASGHINVNHVVAIEPVGIQSVTPVHNLIYFMGEIKPGKEKVQDPDFQDLAPLGSIRNEYTKWDMIRRIGKEVKVYDHVYRSDVGMDFLKSIASTYNVPTDLVVGSKSLAMTKSLRQKTVRSFKGSSVHVDIVSGAAHAFVNPHHRFIFVIDRAKQRLADNLSS